MSDTKDLHMNFMFKDELVCEVWYNFITDTVRFKNYSDQWWLLPFGREDPDTVLHIADLERVLAEYVFPEARCNRREILNKLGLDFYDRFAIVHKTHGVMANTSCWIKFDDDPPELCWETVSKL